MTRVIWHNPVIASLLVLPLETLTWCAMLDLVYRYRRRARSRSLLRDGRVQRGMLWASVAGVVGIAIFPPATASTLGVEHGLASGAFGTLSGYIIFLAATGLFALPFGVALWLDIYRSAVDDDVSEELPDSSR